MLMSTTRCRRAAAASVGRCGVWSAWADGLPVDRIRHSRRSGLVVDVRVRRAAHRSACSTSVAWCRNVRRRVPQNLFSTRSTVT